MTKFEPNYSLRRLQEEFPDREPIREALERLRTRFGVKGWAVAELGSGVGTNLALFARDNEVVGVEGLEEAAISARERGITTLVANLEKELPLASEKYDLILCLDVLEHLVRPELCLEEARRLLRHSGRLVINVPNHFSLSGRLNLLRGSGIDSTKFFPESSDWSYPHIRFFRHGSIIALLKQAGFTVVEDWSGEFPSVPILQKVKHIIRSRLMRWLAARWPDLFAGGFFLIVTKARLPSGWIIGYQSVQNSVRRMENYGCTFFS